MEDLLATHAGLPRTACFLTPARILFHARLGETPAGLWLRARAEGDPAPDLAAAEAALAAFDRRLGERLLRAPGPQETRLDRPFRRALRRHLSRLANTLGAAWEDAGQPDRAFAAYRDALRWDADNAIALLNAAAIARAGHVADPAARASAEADLRAFAKAIAKGRLPREALDAQIDRFGPLRDYALLARLPGAFATDGGAEALHALLLRAGDTPPTRALLVRAGLHLRRGERDRAEACLRQALVQTPGDLTVLLALARLRHEAGDPAEALALLGRAPPEAAPRLAADRAACLMGLRRWPEAKAAAHEALRARPDDAAAQAIAILATRRAEGTAPPELLNRLRASPYHEAMVRAELAELDGKPAEALRHVRDAWRLRPDADGLLTRLVDLALRVGAWDTAEANAPTLLRRDPANRTALLALGLARQRQGDFARASAYLGRLIALGGAPHPIALVAQSGNLLREGRAAEAVRLAERAARADPKALPAAVAVAVARARAKIGDPAEALARVRALDPKGAVPQTVFAEGWVALARGDRPAMDAARARLRARRDDLAADPEGRADLAALETALDAALEATRPDPTNR